MDDPKGERIARELASHLAALLTPEPPGGGPTLAGPRAGPAGPALPSLAGPRTILENGARFASPVLPADAPFRAAKALVLRALRIVTRDQTVFNAAVAEALRSGLSETEDVLRDLSRRAATAEGEARRVEEWADERLRDAFAGLERLEGRDEALSSALAEERVQAAAARDALASRLAATEAGAREEARRTAESLEREAVARQALGSELLGTERRADALEDAVQRLGEDLGREAGAREALGRELVGTQRRADALEDAVRRLGEDLGRELVGTQRRADALEEGARRAVEAVEREAGARGALAAEHHATQRRLDVVEALGERRDRDLDREAGAREALAREVRETQRRVDAVEMRADEVRPRIVEAERRAEAAEGELRALQGRSERLSEELRAARLEWSVLRAALRGRGAEAIVPAGVPAPLPRPATARADLLTAGLYADFERRFRGNEAEIRRRQEDDAALLATAPGPVADLGCGRGELLEALQARGVPALGCDSNPVMVARCREKGLAVDEADLFDWLAAQPDGTLGGVTAYQVVEHLPSEALAPLVELAAQKLAPGGRILLETVNPESVYAMRWFWMDLTHVRPVPGPSLAQLLSAAGFRDVEVSYRAEVPESVSGPLSSVTDPVLAAAGRLLFAPQDVVVTGVR